MKLDHFVVHIENDDAILEQLKRTIEPLGFPFEPTWGKGTAGFKAANIWIGRQYFEIIRLLKPDGGGWPEKWVQRHHTGKRGVYCIFLVTDDLSAIANSLSVHGVPIQGPERISFRAFFGLFKKTLPWQLIYLPEIPGTHLEIGFIQYDPDPKDRIKQFLVPNSDERGIMGISAATVHLPLDERSREFLKRVFPGIQENGHGLSVPLKNGELKFLAAATTFVDLKADVNSDQLKERSFRFENLSVHT